MEIKLFAPGIRAKVKIVINGSEKARISTSISQSTKQLLKFDNEFLAYPVHRHGKINNLLDIFSLFQKKLLSKTLEKSEIQNF